MPRVLSRKGQDQGYDSKLARPSLLQIKSMATLYRESRECFLLTRGDEGRFLEECIQSTRHRRDIQRDFYSNHHYRQSTRRYFQHTHTHTYKQHTCVDTHIGTHARHAHRRCNQPTPPHLNSQRRKHSQLSKIEWKQNSFCVKMQGQYSVCSSTSIKLCVSSTGSEHKDPLQVASPIGICKPLLTLPPSLHRPHARSPRATHHHLAASSQPVSLGRDGASERGYPGPT